MKTILIALAVLIAAPMAATAGPKHCPPGLAKKDPPCVPPGLAKKGVEIGDYYGDYDHIEIDGPDRRFGWYRLGEDIYVRTDRETGEILELFTALAAVMD